MLKIVDDFLNGVTMYRLVLYYLAVLLVAALLFSFFGILPYDPTAMVFSTVLIIVLCAGVQWIFARVYRVAANIESTYITALILALIIPPVPASNIQGVGFLVFASVWAIASKFMIAPGKKHVFNPAAFAVALSAVAINQPATWWVGGNIPLLPFALIGGLLIVRKIQRFDLVASFTVLVLSMTAIAVPHENYAAQVFKMLAHSPFFFFAFVMLTEPLTTPPQRGMRLVYGAFVGLLFAPAFHVGDFYLTPELALLAGNIFSYAVSPKGRFMLALKEIQEAAHDTYDFLFIPDRKFSFQPGQYMEWTLGHRYPDNRGNRRYFTIASSPGENMIRLGVKFYPHSSTFKHALAQMEPGGQISVSHLAGGFVLPKDPKEKLVFIAGGIGVTPFRSMVQHLLDIRERRDIVVLYSNKTKKEVAYKDVFGRAASELGIQTLYAFTEEEVEGAGPITPARILNAIPDYRGRTFYISGPRGMVEAFKKTLRELGVSPFKIKTDFFPGFA